MNRRGNPTHNYSKTKMYQKWGSMKRRCTNTHCNDYKNYGGRGISFCDEWSDFIPFMKWALKNGYSDSLELDRIDNDLGYNPENCRFVTKLVNGSNKRNNIYITKDNITKTMSEWSRILGISRKTIQSRLKYGWTGEKLLLPSRIGNNQFTNYEGDN